MKISKIAISVSIIILIILLVLVGRFGYSMGQYKASLTVREATPKDLAEAMQGDNFWGKYPDTMLLVTGKVKSVDKQNNDTLVAFQTTKAKNVLPKVTCDFKGTVSAKTGDTIRILTVAFDAQRKRVADVYLQNCFLLNN